MSHPIRAAVPAVLLAVATTAHAGAFDATPARATPYTDPLVPAIETQPGIAMPADEPSPPDAPPRFQETDPAADAGADAGAGYPAPPVGVRTGPDGKPAGIGSVPEPHAYALLCGGLGLLGASAVRGTRRQQKSPVRASRTGLAG